MNLKYRASLYSDAEVFSLPITNPNERPMLPFNWYIHSGLILAQKSGEQRVIFCFILEVRKPFELNERKLKEKSLDRLTPCLSYLKMWSNTVLSVISCQLKLKVWRKLRNIIIVFFTIIVKL